MKKILIIIGAIILVLVVAIFVVPQFIPADTYKGLIIARVSNATGRKVTISGPLSLKLFPSIAIAASDVAIANPPGSAAPDLARVKKLDLALELTPLLSGRVVIDRFVLVDPAINLEIDAKGRPNWAFGPSDRAATAGTAVSSKAAMSTGLEALSRLRLAGMTIQNGNISYLDRRTGQHQELKNVDLTVAMPALDRPLTVKGAVQWRGQKIALSAKLDDPGAVTGAGKSALAASLTAKPVAAKFTGTVTSATTGKNAGLALDGSADLAMPSVRDFIRWSGVNATLPAHGFGAMSLAGKAHIAGGIAKFTDARFALDTIKATGAATFDMTGARPMVTGTLQTGMLDFNPYLGAGRAGGAAVAAGSGGRAGWSSQPIDVAPLRQIDCDLDLKAQGIRYRRIEIGASDLSIKLKQAKLVIDLRRMALYQGSAKGEVQMDAARSVPRYVIDASVSNVAIRPLTLAVSNTSPVEGTGSWTLSATAAGDNQRAIVSSLGGKGRFRIDHGRIGGVNLGAMLKNTTSAFTQGGGASTTIGTAKGSFTISRGMLHNPDLVVTMSGLDATGTGTVNLPARTVDYRLTPRLIAGIVTVPVIVSGPWDDLHYRPDLAGIAKGLVQTPGKALEGAAGIGKTIGKGLGSGVGKNLGNGIGNTFKGLFGK